jgi:tRNA(Ile)-lysidine synthase
MAAALLRRCEFPPPGEAVECAVSGGADSLALLVLATAAGCRVTAWHVDHGLRGTARGDAEAAVVASAAARYGATFRRVAVTVAPGPNLEERARQARFAALPDGVCTGHTADDQAETVLLALLRGAGIDGLAGMGPAHHPLLALRRAETVALCREEALVPVEDPTNRDPSVLRNRVRHELLPLASELAGRDLVPVLGRSAAVLRGDAELLAGCGAAVDASDARALAAAPTPLARRAVRAWLAARAPHPPSLAAVDRVIAVARGDAVACQVAGVGRVERHAQRLSVQPATHGASDGDAGPPGGVQGGRVHQ